MGTTAAPVHVWEKVEITLQASNAYANPYTDVQLWVDLKGPGFEKRGYGFWDGDNTFRVRIVATGPGQWTWRSASQPADAGLSAQHGMFEAVAWTEEEKQANPNRRGFVRATPNHHALNYGDGSPFFLFADTWWSASTRVWSWGRDWGASGISFQDAVSRRKAQGYNGVAMIASFPNWAEDGFPKTIKKENVVIRTHGWRTQDMVDEDGGRPFAMRAGPGGAADFDRLQPSYFRHLDRKMQYLSDEGFVPFFETVRRDHGESWKVFTPDWEHSFARYVNYLLARYGCYNLIFSVLHYDMRSSLPIEDWRSAIQTWHRTYGLPPFGQVVTALCNPRTDENWGHGPSAPWLQLHGVGNKTPRTNRFARWLYDQFLLPDPLPTLCQEPIYPGWSPDTPLDDSYAPRCMAWSCVLQGGLAGHIYGSRFFDGKDAVQGLTAAGSDKLPVLAAFLLSEGSKYQELVPVRRLESEGLEGSAVIARTADANLLMAYFQRHAKLERLAGLRPGTAYRAQWFNPRSGEWLNATMVAPDTQGCLMPPPFPDSPEDPGADWALKLVSTP